MDWRTIPSLALGVLAVACAAGAFEQTAPSPTASPVPRMERLPEGGEYGALVGIVSDKDSHEKLGQALIVLQCACLDGTRETMTDDDGLYGFRDLPAGKYTVQALHGQADTSAEFQLDAAFRVRVDFAIAPNNEFLRT